MIWHGRSHYDYKVSSTSHRVQETCKLNASPYEACSELDKLFVVAVPHCPDISLELFLYVLLCCSNSSYFPLLYINMTSPFKSSPYYFSPCHDQAEMDQSSRMI